MIETNSLVDVVVAVIVDQRGRYLMAQRPSGKVYEGFWEFPGGKVELGESLADALKRELIEELGIEVQSSYPWFMQTYEYPHAHVRLHLYRVVKWRAEPRGLEGQKLVWQGWGEDPVAPMLPANQRVFNALSLPVVYGITHGRDMTEPLFLEALERACFRGLRLIQLRENDLPIDLLGKLADKVLAIAKHYSAKVLINSNVELANQIGAHGVHLKSSQLMSLRDRPCCQIVGASCHNQEELARAVDIGCDFVVLGPVQSTLSHPDQSPLGWQHFSNLQSNSQIPIFALGGLSPQDLSIAYQHGAHGVASMRQIWQGNSPIANRFRALI